MKPKSIEILPRMSKKQSQNKKYVNIKDISNFMFVLIEIWNLSLPCPTLVSSSSAWEVVPVTGVLEPVLYN